MSEKVVLLKEKGRETIFAINMQDYPWAKSRPQVADRIALRISSPTVGIHLNGMYTVSKVSKYEFPEEKTIPIVLMGKEVLPNLLEIVKVGNIPEEKRTVSILLVEI